MAEQHDGPRDDPSEYDPTQYDPTQYDPFSGYQGPPATTPQTNPQSNPQGNNANSQTNYPGYGYQQPVYPPTNYTAPMPQ